MIGRQVKLGLASLAILVFGIPAMPVFGADGTVVCGMLQAIRPVDVTQRNEGSVTIDGRIYVLGATPPTNGVNTLSPSAVIGKRACLSGTRTGATGAFDDYTLVGCANQSGIPGCDPTPFDLPVDSWQLLTAAGVLTMAAASLAHRRRREGSPRSTDVDRAVHDAGSAARAWILREREKEIHGTSNRPA